MCPGERRRRARRGRRGIGALAAVAEQDGLLLFDLFLEFHESRRFDAESGRDAAEFQEAQHHATGLAVQHEAIRFEHDGLVDAKLAAPAEEVVHVIPSEERFRLGVLPALELEFRHRLLLTNKTDTGKCTNAIRSSDAPIQHVQTRGIDNLAIGKPVYQKTARCSHARQQ